MSPEDVKLYTAAVRIAARLDTLFAEGMPAKWRLRIPEGLFASSHSRKWAAFAAKQPDALHAVLLQKVTGLSELRKAFRSAKKLASMSVGTGNTPLVFRELLKDLLNGTWLLSIWENETSPSWSDDGIELEHLEFLVNPSCRSLANRMVKAMEALVVENGRQEQQIQTTRKFQSDALESQADVIHFEAHKSGMTIDPGEAIECARSPGRPRTVTPELRAEAKALYERLGSWKTATAELNRIHNQNWKVSTVEGWNRYSKRRDREPDVKDETGNRHVA